jgi:hypothetical protein
MHVISLYLLLYACAATFDVMCVKKTEATKRGHIQLYINILFLPPSIRVIFPLAFMLSFFWVAYAFLSLLWVTSLLKSTAAWQHRNDQYM